MYDKESKTYTFSGTDDVSNIEYCEEDTKSGAITSVKSLVEKYKKEFHSTYFEYPKKTYKKDRKGMAHAILAGYTDSERDNGKYIVMASNGTTNYMMICTYPVEDKNTENPKGKPDYVLDCLYRGLSYSGSTKSIRSYEDFLKDQN